MNKKTLFIIIGSVIIFSAVFLFTNKSLASNEDFSSISYNSCTLNNLNECSRDDLMRVLIQVLIKIISAESVPTPATPTGKVAPIEDAPILDIACIQVYDPVCGENGRNYSNSCYAEVDGTSIAYRGNCGSDLAGKIVKFYQINGEEYIDVNFIKFVRSDYVYGEKLEQGTCDWEISPNGYCVVDNDDKIVSFKVNSNAVVVPSAYPSAETPYYVPEGGLWDFQSPYVRIELVGNEVRRIKEIYVP